MTETERCPSCTSATRATANHLGFELAVCDVCGLWFWPHRQAADYEAVYLTPEYKQVQIAEWEEATDLSQFIYHPTYAPFFREVPHTKGAQLLDIGCGVGRFLAAAHSLGWEVRGIDTSHRAIEVGRGRASFPMSTETLEQLNRAGERFDVVTAFEVMEHLEHPIEVLQSVRSVLKPGGRVFCTVPNRDSPAVRSTRRQDWLPPVHLQFFVPAAMRRMLACSGYEDVRTGYIWVGTLPPFNLSTRALRQTVGYLLRRGAGRVRPDPLGIWAVGRLTS